MTKDYRARIFEDYTNNSFALHIDLKDIDFHYAQHEAYFKKNYLPFMPADKDAAIIDVGCGIGDFLNFVQKQGYKNTNGIDLSKDNIEI